jgi:hypothetical protein
LLSLIRNAWLLLDADILGAVLAEVAADAHAKVAEEGARVLCRLAVLAITMPELQRAMRKRFMLDLSTREYVDALLTIIRPASKTSALTQEAGAWVEESLRAVVYGFEEACSDVRQGHWGAALEALEDMVNKGQVTLIGKLLWLKTSSLAPQSAAVRRSRENLNRIPTRQELKAVLKLAVRHWGPTADCIWK